MYLFFLHYICLSNYLLHLREVVTLFYVDIRRRGVDVSVLHFERVS